MTNISIESLPTGVDPERMSPEDYRDYLLKKATEGILKDTEMAQLLALMPHSKVRAKDLGFGPISGSKPPQYNQQKIR